MITRTLILGAVIAALVTPAHAASSHDTVCQGDVYSAENAADPYFRDATWIGECYIKNDSEAAHIVLAVCHTRASCTVRAAVQDRPNHPRPQRQDQRA